MHIKSFMTTSAHAIGRDQSIKLAHERMQGLGVRHLPVLDGGVLVGVISERDIALVSTLTPDQIDTLTVEEAMSTEPYSVAPEADVVDVASQMADHKYGSAVVMDHNKVAGIFTTTDAMHLLADLLQTASQDGSLATRLQALADTHAKPQK
jgi:acetoin utilization protein AcuB